MSRKFLAALTLAGLLLVLSVAPASAAKPVTQPPQIQTFTATIDTSTASEGYCNITFNMTWSPAIKGGGSSALFLLRFVVGNSLNLEMDQVSLKNGQTSLTAIYRTTSGHATYGDVEAQLLNKDNTVLDTADQIGSLTCPSA